MTDYECGYYHKFRKELGKLSRKCPTLYEDFERFKESLLEDLEFYKHKLPNNRYIKLKLKRNRLLPFPAFKVKHFRCKAINKGANSGFRIVFILDQSNWIIYFVEIYHKNKKIDLNEQQLIDASEDL
ncbi:MAG: hypothetical protein LBT10_06145 [Methanobrevibacter sp.]|jgi:mRNA-degrading endonuclease RelE of RelBE toxin-antitoxin system|nr:hypothetical protein [Methanobrevibacter sp.]